ncbi:MAG TPA: hypothetical protein VM901_10020 [Bdellovibrionota bacterium]|nr:hypothetical protein [Bdellovibrionota bacterium]
MKSTKPVDDFIQNLDPPQPARRIRFPIAQKIGVPILLTLFIATLVFGIDERRTTTEDHFGPIHLRLDYPTRVIAGTAATFRITVRNESRARVDNISLHLDHRLVDQSEKVTAIPAARDPYTISLGTLFAGETKYARWELSPQAYLKNSNAIAVYAGAQKLGSRDFDFWLIP